MDYSSIPANIREKIEYLTEYYESIGFVDEPPMAGSDYEYSKYFLKQSSVGTVLCRIRLSKQNHLENN